MGVAPVDEPDFDSTMTASNVRLVTSFGNVAACFANVTDASLSVCLNWLWISGSPLSNKMLNTGDVGDMKIPRGNTV
jgi:hypothetical protein